jgi:TetR/AcrR family tetracycline transcriptional repressor
MRRFSSVTNKSQPMKRAPRPQKLSKDKIVAAALAVIDRRGAADFSLRDVARRLGVYPTAIYWHVPSRNALIGEIAAYAIRDIVPPVDPRNWRAWLKGLFRRYRVAVRRHPNIAPLLGAQLVSNEGVDARMIEGMLVALTHAGYRGRALVDAFNVVVVTMSNFVTMELAPEPAEDPRGWAAGLERRIRALASSDYPTLARHLPAMANRAFILRWQNGTKVPLDRSFEAFIDCVIRGLAQRAGLRSQPKQPGRK